MDSVVHSYAQQAIDRWTVTHVLADRPRATPRGPHDPDHCGCLVCSDGREALGMRPLVPSWARRAVPDVYRRRWTR